MQGKIIGRMNALGFIAKEEATLTALTLDVVKSSEIEGELLNYEQVRSSIARRLGINHFFASNGWLGGFRRLHNIVSLFTAPTDSGWCILIYKQS